MATSVILDPAQLRDRSSRSNPGRVRLENAEPVAKSRAKCGAQGCRFSGFTPSQDRHTVRTSGCRSPGAQSLLLGAARPQVSRRQRELSSSAILLDLASALVWGQIAYRRRINDFNAQSGASQGFDLAYRVHE